MSTEADDRARRISDYARSRLDEEQAKQLEIEMLDDDELFAEIQREELLRIGLRETSLDDGATGVARWRWWQPALGGALGLAVVVLTIQNLRLADQLDGLRAPSTGVPVITLHQQRSLLPAADGPEQALAEAEGPVLLEVDVSAFEHEAFDLEVEAGSQRYRWPQVAPDERGYVTVLLKDTGSGFRVRVSAPDGELLSVYRIAAQDAATGPN